MTFVLGLELKQYGQETDDICLSVQDDNQAYARRMVHYNLSELYLLPDTDARRTTCVLTLLLKVTPDICQMDDTLLA